MKTIIRVSTLLAFAGLLGLAATWRPATHAQNVTPLPSTPVLAYSVTTESASTALTSGTLTTVNTKAVTFPSSGCPCRVFVFYNQYVTTTGTTQVAETLVSDGVNNFAESEWSISVNNGPSGTGSGMSPVLYANNAAVTFTLKIQVDSTGTTAQQAPFHAFGGRNSRLEIAVVPSN
jgi:hypothetical protein